MKKYKNNNNYNNNSDKIKNTNVYNSGKATKRARTSRQGHHLAEHPPLTRICTLNEWLTDDGAEDVCIWGGSEFQNLAEVTANYPTYDSL